MTESRPVFWHRHPIISALLVCVIAFDGYLAIDAISAEPVTGNSTTKSHSPDMPSQQRSTIPTISPPPANILNMPAEPRHGDALQDPDAKPSDIATAKRLFEAGDVANAQFLLQHELSSRQRNGDPIPIEAFQLLRSILSARGNDAEFLAALLSLPSESPEKPALMAEHAIYLADNSRPAEAQSIFDTAIETHPDNSQIIQAYLAFVISREDATSALPHLKRLLTTAPSFDVPSIQQTIDRLQLAPNG